MSPGKSPNRFDSETEGISSFQWRPKVVSLSSADDPLVPLAVFAANLREEFQS